MLISLGFNVIEASEAKEAIELIELLEDIYCLVSDVRLHGVLNGFDIADCFRSYHEQSPVVLMTGYAFDETLQRRAGNEYFVLRKPFDINELKEVFSVKYNNNSGASIDEPT
jgi:CheY-like chemotaxis protein